MNARLEEPDWAELGRLPDDKRFALDAEMKRELIANISFMHFHLQSTLDRLIHLLIPNNGISIIVVSGVSGVGKSILLEKILEGTLMQKKYARKDGVLYVSADAEIDRGIMIKAFYTIVLRAGKEPMIDDKVVFVNDNGRLKVNFGKRGPRASDLVGWTKNMFKNRNFHVFVVDEVIHLLQHGDETIMLDMLKSVSKEGCPKLVVVSDVVATRQARSHDQYVRRGRCVMLQRYVAEEQEGENLEVVKREFKAIMRKYMKIWPWKQKPDLVKMSEEIRFQSLGDMGLVKQFLIPALELQNNNNGVWDDEFIRMQFLTRQSRSDLDKKWREAEAEMRKYAWGLEDSEPYQKAS